MSDGGTRRVLMIGGSMDGKWHTKEGKGHFIRIMKPLDFKRVVFKEDALAEPVDVPQYEEYILENVALYGEGVWVGIHRETMDKLDMEPGGGWRSAHTTMILRAILQRDVATEMGL